jgi:hypothetical protein
MFVSLRRVEGGWIVQHGEQEHVFVDEMKLIRFLRSEVEERVRAWVTDAMNAKSASVTLQLTS